MESELAKTIKSCQLGGICTHIMTVYGIESETEFRDGSIAIKLTNLKSAVKLIDVIARDLSLIYYCHSKEKKHVIEVGIEIPEEIPFSGYRKGDWVMLATEIGNYNGEVAKVTEDKVFIMYSSSGTQYPITYPFPLNECEWVVLARKQ